MLVARFTDHSASRRREEEVPVPSTGPISARAQAKPLSLAEKRETPLRCAGRNPSRAHPYALHNGARLSAPPRIPTDLQCSPPASSLDRWYGWALRSRREPMKQVARTFKQYRDCILRRFVSKIQWPDRGHQRLVQAPRSLYFYCNHACIDSSL